MTECRAGNDRRIVRRTPSRRATRLFVLVCALGAVAVAPFEASAQPPRPRVKLRAYQVDITLDTLVFARDTVTASVGETFAAVRAVYAALKIPRDYADSTNGQIGTLRHRATYTLGGQRLSVYFNCGQGIAGGQRRHVAPEHGAGDLRAAGGRRKDAHRDGDRGRGAGHERHVDRAGDVRVDGTAGVAHPQGGARGARDKGGDWAEVTWPPVPASRPLAARRFSALAALRCSS